MRLWEIIKLADEKKLTKGDQFKAINIPFDLVLEFDEDDSLVYNTIMGNTTERKAVSLCDGEMRTEFIQLSKRGLREFDMIKELTIDPLLKAKRSDGYWDGYIYFHKEGHLVWEDGKSHYIVTGSTALWDVFLLKEVI